MLSAEPATLLLPASFADRKSALAAPTSKFAMDDCVFHDCSTVATSLWVDQATAKGIGLVMLHSLFLLYQRCA